jgi:hypothetical protein
MAEDSSHRLRWLVLALLLAATMYLIRARRTAPVDRDRTGATPGLAPSSGDGPVRPVPHPAAAREPVAGPPAPAPEARPVPRPRRTATVELPPGAAAALPDGSPPGPEYTIKAKAGSALFHSAGSPYFARTRAEFWFRTAADAEAAGFTAWAPRRRSAE